LIQLSFSFAGFTLGLITIVHKIWHFSITALLDMTEGDVRFAQAHSRHKNLSTLIRYDDGRQQLQRKAAKKLAESIT
jgi:integrase/recombinase XerC